MYGYDTTDHDTVVYDVPVDVVSVKGGLLSHMISDDLMLVMTGWIPGR